MAKVVLLDVDGVIFTNKKMLNHVRERIVRYVQDTAQTKRKRAVPLDEALVLSDNLYKNFGHTLRGVWGLYGRRDHSLTEFNDFVYNKSIMNLLNTYLHFSAEVEWQADNVRKLTKECAKRDYHIGIYSNAPLNWCSTICNYYGLDIDSDLMYTSSHPLFLTSYERLKPDPGLYADIASNMRAKYSFKVKQRESYKPDAMEIRFMDDSLTNLAPVVFTKEWVPLHYKHPDDMATFAFSHTVATASREVFDEYKRQSLYIN